MPVFEPSTEISKNQEQLAAILVPVLVMLGGMGLSYGIYTALRWVSSSNRQGFHNHSEADPNPEAVAKANDPEKLTAHPAMQPDAQQLSQESSSTTTSASSTHPTQLPVIRSEAILAKKTMKTQKNVDSTQFGKHVSTNSRATLAQQRSAQLVISTSIPAKGKENSNPHVPKQPSPLKDGYKPGVDSAPVAPGTYESAIHPLHGYHYF